MHTCLYSEQNEEVIDLIRRLMCTNQPPLTQRLIYALKGLYPPEIVEYLLGVYYLEFAKAYVLGGGRYIETKVSFRRARRRLKRALCANPRDAEILTAIGESYAGSGGRCRHSIALKRRWRSNRTTPDLSGT